MGLGQLFVPMGRQPDFGQRPTFAEDKVGVEHCPCSPGPHTQTAGWFTWKYTNLFYDNRPLQGEKKIRLERKKVHRNSKRQTSFIQKHSKYGRKKVIIIFQWMKNDKRTLKSTCVYDKYKDIWILLYGTQETSVKFSGAVQTFAKLILK